MNTTTPLKDFATLADAKKHIEPFQRMLSPDMVINFLTVHHSLDILLASTDEKAKGLVFALQSGVSEFNLMNNPPDGIGKIQQQLIGYLVSIGALTQECFDACVSYANKTRMPYEFTTKQEFQYAKGTITRKQITWESGYCKLVLTSDAAEAHNPQIFKRIRFSDGSFEDQRVAGFRDVYKAKTSEEKPYRVQCPCNSMLVVDDAYGVVS
jgi:hypothetical protein